MLNVMRENLKHLKFVLWAVAGSMLLYLGSFLDWRGTRGAGADWAARVDGTAISSQEFLETARNQDEYYRSLLGDQYEQMKKNLRVGSQALQSIVDRKLVLAEAKGLGLEATAEEVSKAILVDPSFKTQDGAFIGKERYTAAVEQQVAGGIPAFERRLADSIVARKWLGLMTASAEVADREVEMTWRTRNERGAVDYVFVPSASAPFDTAVDDATATAWYQSHPSSYMRPESRRLKVLIVDRQTQLAKVQVSDDDVRHEYDANRNEYQRPEQRRARHILFKIPPGGGEADKRSLRDLAASVLARVQKGEDFAALARSMSQDAASAAKGGDLGWLGRGSMVKPVEDAVFATPPGQFAPVVETDYGFQVIQTLEDRPAGTVAFEEVRDTLRRRMELQRAQDAAAAEAQRLKAGIASIAELDAAAAKAGLQVEVTLFSADDRALDLGPSPEFGQAAASLAAGQVSAPVGVARGLAILGCTEVLPPAARPLAEVIAQVKTDVLNERARGAALVIARRIAAASSLASGAASARLEVKSSGDLAPGAVLPGVGVIPDLDKTLFAAGTAVGTKGAVVTATGALAYVVTRHDAFDPAKFQADRDALRAQILEQRRTEMLQGIIEALRQKHTVEINQALVDSVNG